MNKIYTLLEKHFTKLGCKCDVMDNTKQYQAAFNAIYEALYVGLVSENCCEDTKHTPEELVIVHLSNETYQVLGEYGTVWKQGSFEECSRYIEYQ